MTLPFPFSFYGQTYTSANVCTNGFVTFGTGTCPFTVTSSCPVVLVDHASEQPAPMHCGVEWDHDGWIVLGRVSVQALMGSVFVELPDVVALPRSWS